MPQLTVKQRYAQLDAAARRRERRGYMPALMVQDAHDLAIAIDESNQYAPWVALRRELLRRAAETWASQHTVGDRRLQELEDYLEGRAELPEWAQAVSELDGMSRRRARALNGGAPVEAGSSRGPDPDDPNRFQLARGRFAQPGDPGFSPDRR